MKVVMSSTPLKPVLYTTFTWRHVVMSDGKVHVSRKVASSEVTECLDCVFVQAALSNGNKLVVYV